VTGEVDLSALVNMFFASNAIATRGPKGRKPTKAVYRTSSIKRGRRTKAEIGAIRDALCAVVAEQQPMTVRQVFYQLVSRGVVAKTEGEYTRTVCRLLTELRVDKTIPFDWIADNTRWMRKPRTYSSLEAALQNTAQTYRRAVWDEQLHYVEIWLEKDALAGVVYDVTERWDVPLMVTRGYPSLSFLHGAAEALAELDRPAFLYYFGDHDPSGKDIPRSTEARLRELAPDAEIHFAVVTVTPEQIEGRQLPTRPTKASDPRSGKFSGESVEVDAILPGALRELVERCISRHVEMDVLETLRVAEAEERKALVWLAAKADGRSPQAFRTAVLRGQNWNA